MITASKMQVSLLTPVGRGAVASIVIRGPHAAKTADQYFHPLGKIRLGHAQINRVLCGHFRTTEDEAGEEVVACRTAEEKVEIHCHGGRAAAERILTAFGEAGCTCVDWRETVEIADDALAAEARIALAAARTQRVAGVLLDQYRGTLKREIERIIGLLRQPDKTVEADRALNALLARAEFGLHLTEPWRIAVVGQPNVGKSSLVNAIVGFSRSIVFPQPGTTRDVVTVETAIDGWPVEFRDTAGIREGGDEIEKQGIERARAQRQSADLVLLVCDASRPLSDADFALAEGLENPLWVYNKSDLANADHYPPSGRVGRGSGRAALQKTGSNPRFALPARSSRPSRREGEFGNGWHWTSAVTGQGIDALLTAIGRRLVADTPSPDTPVPFTSRQIGLLSAAKAALRDGRSTSVSSLTQLVLPESI
jgi:tRNA modification GTPase